MEAVKFVIFMFVHEFPLALDSLYTAALKGSPSQLSAFLDHKDLAGVTTVETGILFECKPLGFNVDDHVVTHAFDVFFLLDVWLHAIESCKQLVGDFPSVLFIRKHRDHLGFPILVEDRVPVIVKGRHLRHKIITQLIVDIRHTRLYAGKGILNVLLHFGICYKQRGYRVVLPQ